MPARMTLPLVAVDIGNTNLKFGLFPSQGFDADPLPLPASSIGLSAANLDALLAWLHPRRPDEVSWLIGSVQRAFCTRLLDWLRAHDATERTVLLTSRDLPLQYALERPDMVGIDRLLGAVGANRLRDAGRPAVVVDMGTAITVDWVTAEGAFGGGAILAGSSMSARALHEFTDLLPYIEMAELTDAPQPMGKATEAAMRSGLFWGAVGAVRELVARMRESSLNGAQDGGAQAAAGAAIRPPQVFLTGGAAPSVAHLLAADAVFVEHLVLQGMAYTARERLLHSG